MIMPNTKLTKQKGSKYWRLFVQKDGKYKVAYRHESKKLLKKKRAEIQTQSIDINALIAKRTFVDVYKEFANIFLKFPHCGHLARTYPRTPSSGRACGTKW